MLFKGDPYTKEEFLNLLKTMFELFHIATKDGLMNVEPHIEKPESSAIFSKNPFLLHHHHALPYLADTLKLLLTGGVPAYDLEALLDADNDTHHLESAQAPGLLSKVSDSLPGLGIVAAVLGIITTMQAINGPPEQIGMSVAAASGRNIHRYPSVLRFPRSDGCTYRDHPGIRVTVHGMHQDRYHLVRQGECPSDGRGVFTEGHLQ
jgi:flagellar motor component MotA